MTDVDALLTAARNWIALVEAAGRLPATARVEAMTAHLVHLYAAGLRLPATAPAPDPLPTPPWPMDWPDLGEPDRANPPATLLLKGITSDLAIGLGWAERDPRAAAAWLRTTFDARWGTLCLAAVQRLHVAMMASRAAASRSPAHSISPETSSNLDASISDRASAVGPLPSDAQPGPTVARGAVAPAPGAPSGVQSHDHSEQPAPAGATAAGQVPNTRTAPPPSLASAISDDAMTDAAAPHRRAFDAIDPKPAPPWTPAASTRATEDAHSARTRPVSPGLRAGPLPELPLASPDVRADTPAPLLQHIPEPPRRRATGRARPRPDDPGILGLRCEPTALGLRVEAVHPAGPAADLLHEGDLLTAIDGHPLADLDLAGAQAALSSASGQRRELSLIRGDEQHTFSLVAVDPNALRATPTALRVRLVDIDSAYALLGEIGEAVDALPDPEHDDHLVLAATPDAPQAHAAAVAAGVAAGCWEVVGPA